jgi:hypothetical protein
MGVLITSPHSLRMETVEIITAAERKKVSGPLSEFSGKKAVSLMHICGSHMGASDAHRETD